MRAYLEQIANGRDPDVLAAKLVGRWQDGTPLVSSPHGPDPAIANDPLRVNDFRYDGDPEGMACPIGAHVRRANPRDHDGFFGGKLSDRHRIIRRGRAYGPPLADDVLEDDGVDRGLIFKCYQADIERQFEMIQSLWIDDGDSFGVGDDKDPIIGLHSEGGGRMIVQGRPPVVMGKLPTFVTVRGGEYLIRPGMRALRWLARAVKAVLAGGARTPIGRFGGALAGVDAVELGAHAVRAALERCPGLEPDYVAVGNVLQAANGQNPGRRAALAGGVRRDVPGITLNDVCLASMSAVALGVAMLRAEEAGVVLVGGFDSMTRAPTRCGCARREGRRPAADRRDGRTTASTARSPTPAWARCRTPRTCGSAISREAQDRFAAPPPARRGRRGPARRGDRPARRPRARRGESGRRRPTRRSPRSRPPSAPTARSPPATPARSPTGRPRR